MTVENWNKPIETVDGNEAYYLRDTDDGKKLVVYCTANGIDWRALAAEEDSKFFRNKPELIIPDNRWIALYDGGEWRSDKMYYQLNDFAKHYPNAAAYVTLRDLMSGDFKGGIKKGHGKMKRVMK